MIFKVFKEILEEDYERLSDEYRFEKADLIAAKIIDYWRAEDGSGNRLPEGEREAVTLLKVLADRQQYHFDRSQKLQKKLDWLAKNRAEKDDTLPQGHHEDCHLSHKPVLLDDDLSECECPEELSLIRNTND